jgi:hypothetical protein
MLSRDNCDENWTGETANDNEPCRAVAAEGVVQCLQFLANEAGDLGYPAAAVDILRAAFALQAEIDSERSLGPVTAKVVVPMDRSLPAARAPTA